MGKFIKLSDFTGYRSLPLDKKTEDIAAQYITDFENDYLICLLGADLYKEFLADYDSDPADQPTEPRFTAIYGEILFDDSTCGIVHSKGMKDMLVGFIYWEFMRDNPIKKNIGGLFRNTQANSTMAKTSESNIYKAYNESIDSYWAIQRYICLNPENYDYEEFNGQFKMKNSFI